jgi:GT2 family glycosyltransferase
MKKEIPSVGIVILNWNRKEDTLRCLNSVYQLRYPQYEIVVVDNGSTDGSLEAVASAYPRAIRIRLERNLGFSAGNNVGIRLLLDRRHDYILLLNDDSTVKEDLLDYYVSWAESDPSVAALGGKILWMHDDSKTWGTYGRVTYGPTLIVNCGTNEDPAKYKDPEQVDWVIGCGLFLRASVLREIGLLDEALYSFHEDADWCIRARMRGYGVVFLPDAIIWHVGTQSWGGSQMNQTKMYLIWYNILYLARKHGTFPKKLKFFFLFCILTPLWIIKRVLKGEARLVKSYFQALYDFLRGRPNRIWLERGGIMGPEEVDPGHMNVHIPDHRR